MKTVYLIKIYAKAHDFDTPIFKGVFNGWPTKNDVTGAIRKKAQKYPEGHTYHKTIMMAEPVALQFDWKTQKEHIHLITAFTGPSCLPKKKGGKEDPLGSLWVDIFDVIPTGK